MEQKINRLMQLKKLMHIYSFGRHISINEGRYEDAMTNHFFFYSYWDEYQSIKKKLTQKETNAYLSAMFCIDYRNL
jgi:hypothetical protein